MMYRRDLIATALSLFSGVAWSQDTEDTSAQDEDEIVDVSVLNLIAAPAAFDGKKVRVIGYVHLEFEGDALYLHKEDQVRRLIKNGVALYFKLPPGKVNRVNNQYAIVEGRFSMSEKGHLGAMSGSIQDVTRLMPWKAAQ